MPIKIKMSVKDGTISCKFYTSKEAKPKKVSLKVSQRGKNFTIAPVCRRQGELHCQI